MLKISQNSSGFSLNNKFVNLNEFEFCEFSISCEKMAGSCFISLNSLKTLKNSNLSFGLNRELPIF